MVKKRKTIALDEDLVNEISRIAKTKGMSISNYLRRLLLATIKAEKHGVNPEQALLNNIILKYAYHVGLGLSPISNLFDSISIDEWRNIGRKLGVILRIKEIDKEVALINTALNILSSIGEITIEKSKSTYKITCVSAKASKKLFESIATLLIELGKQYNTNVNALVEEGILVLEIKF